jgi:hypothetical protein
MAQIPQVAESHPVQGAVVDVDLPSLFAVHIIMEGGYAPNDDTFHVLRHYIFHHNVIALDHPHGVVIKMVMTDGYNISLQ